ncbi:MAG: hypothetical protein U9P36_15640 [Thermodesulfobacteriota bacterium]|nr:hypothetical protein [Thermodesulfobacteriota bacterium]
MKEIVSWLEEEDCFFQWPGFMIRFRVYLFGGSTIGLKLSWSNQLLQSVVTLPVHGHHYLAGLTSQPALIAPFLLFPKTNYFDFLISRHYK